MVNLLNNKFFDSLNILQISEINFHSLINQKIKSILKEIIKIDNLGYYSIENYKESFDNMNYNELKISRNMKKSRIKTPPLALRYIQGLYYKIDFYWGELDHQGNMEGFGSKIFSNGGFYFGTFKKNKMDGLGEIYYSVYKFIFILFKNSFPFFIFFNFHDDFLNQYHFCFNFEIFIIFLENKWIL